MDGSGERVRVGVVGLGVMGGSIAAHLAARGFFVVGFDLDGAARERAEGTGLSLTASVSELAQQVDVVVTSLPSAAALAAVSDEVAGVATPPRYHLETSTLSLADKLALQARFLPGRTEVLDCPISGTGSQMANGEAVIYASGEAAAYETVRPVLEAFARRVHYVGAFGDGTRLKLVANLLVAVHNVAAAEALALAIRSGLTMPGALDALLDGAGASKMLEVRGPAMLDRRYLPGAMRIGLFEKDLRLIAEHASDCDAETPLFTSSLAIYEQAQQLGLVLEDTAAVFEVLLPPTN